MDDALPFRGSATDPPLRVATRKRRMPLAVGARELAAMLRIGLRTVRTLDAAGRLPKPVRIGHSVRWNLAEIKRWLDCGAPDRETWAAICEAKK